MRGSTLKRGVKMNEQSGKEVFRGKKEEKDPIVLRPFKERSADGFDEVEPSGLLQITHGDTGRGPLETQRR